MCKIAYPAICLYCPRLNLRGIVPCPDLLLPRPKFRLFLVQTATSKCRSIEVKSPLQSFEDCRFAFFLLNEIAELGLLLFDHIQLLIDVGGLALRGNRLVPASFQLVECRGGELSNATLDLFQFLNDMADLLDFATGCVSPPHTGHTFDGCQFKLIHLEI